MCTGDEGRCAGDMVESGLGTGREMWRVAQRGRTPGGSVLGDLRSVLRATALSRMEVAWESLVEGECVVDDGHLG